MKKFILSIFLISTVILSNGQSSETPKTTQILNFKDVYALIEYPKVCKEKGIEGQVLVTLNVGANGELSSYQFLAYSCEDMRDAVVKVLDNLKFTPATNELGDAIASKITMPVKFQLSI